MNYYNEMKAEYNRLSTQIVSLERAIDALPEGSLSWRKKDDVYRYYQYLDSKRKYLSKKDAGMIENLAKKKYLQKMLIDVKAEKNAIGKYMTSHQEKNRALELIAQHPNLEEILSPLFAPYDEKLQAWANEEYPSTAEHPEALIHPGPFGKMYRSKSEVSIAYGLLAKRIPHRYECDLVIQGITYHPDFTIRHPKTGQVIYWEHFGGMDNERYVFRSIMKLKDFESVGIFPDRNMIVTFESRNFPFESWMAEEIIDRWFR